MPCNFFFGVTQWARRTMRIAGIRQRRSGTGARRESEAGRRGGRRVRSRLAFVPCPPSCDAARGVCAVVIMDMMAEDYILVKLIITIRIIIYIYYFHDKNDTHHYDYSNIYLLTYEP